MKGMTAANPSLSLSFTKNKKVTTEDIESLAPTTAGGVESSVASSGLVDLSSVKDIGKKEKEVGDGGERDDSVHSGLGATTVASDDRRTAKSRTSAARSSGTNKMKLAKHMAYLESKKKAVGEEFAPWENQGHAFLLSPEERAANAALAAGMEPELAI